MMSATNKPDVLSSSRPVWPDRVRLAITGAMLWAGLHFCAGPLLPSGLDRPLVLATAPPAGLAVVLLLWVGAALARLIGPAHQTQPLLVVGLGLALWAAEGGRQGGTLGSWLILSNPAPGPPASGPYWALLPDYAFLLAGVVGAHIIAAFRGRRAASASGSSDGGSRNETGPLALLGATVVAGVVALILSGPALGQTFRGQVYFSTLLGTLCGTFVARRITKVDRPVWYWPVPFLLGVVGLVVAGIEPALMLPPEYRGLNIIPAWGLSRALPIEMVGVGLIGALWLLPPTTGPAGGDRDGG